MNDRDKLIEIIYCAGRDYDDCVDAQHEIGMSAYEDFDSWLADDLLANGVILPVRCKDCKHFIPYEMLDHTEYPNEIEADGVCDNIDKYTDIDHFCYYGKLKEREQNG